MAYSYGLLGVLLRVSLVLCTALFCATWLFGHWLPRASKYPNLVSRNRPVIVFEAWCHHVSVLGPSGVGGNSEAKSS